MSNVYIIIAAATTGSRIIVIIVIIIIIVIITIIIIVIIVTIWTIFFIITPHPSLSSLSFTTNTIITIIHHHHHHHHHHSPSQFSTENQHSPLEMMIFSRRITFPVTCSVAKSQTLGLFFHQNSHQQTHQTPNPPTASEPMKPTSTLLVLDTLAFWLRSRRCDNAVFSGKIDTKTVKIGRSEPKCKGFSVDLWNRWDSNISKETCSLHALHPWLLSDKSSPHLVGTFEHPDYKISPVTPIRQAVPTHLVLTSEVKDVDGFNTSWCCKLGKWPWQDSGRWVVSQFF